MSNSIINSLRVVPRAADFLDRKLGSKGEIFFDQTSNTLRLYNGITAGGFKLAKADLTNISNADFLAKSTAAGVSSGSSALNFKTISVAGQSDVVAEITTDTLTLIAGNNITLTTDSTSDSITIAASASSIPTASTSVLGGVKVDGTSIVISNGTISAVQSQATAETFSFSVAGDDSTMRVIANNNVIRFRGVNGIVTSTDADGAVTIDSSGIANTFSSLDDSGTASLTVDKLYLPAITMLLVTNIGATSYRFDQYGTANNPTIYAISGTTIAFNLSVTGHGFIIQDGTGTDYNTGLYHVDTDGVVSTGADAQAMTSGTLYWKIPIGTTGTYRYQSETDVPMVGAITIKNFVAL